MADACFVYISDWQRLKTAATQRQRQAFRPGTTANQHSHVLLYLAFTIYFRVRDFPARIGVLLFFGEFLLRSFQAHKSVTNALSSLCTFHRVYGFDGGAFEDFRFQLFKRALPLTVRHVPNPAPPLSLSVLQ